MMPDHTDDARSYGTLLSGYPLEATIDAANEAGPRAGREKLDTPISDKAALK